VLRRFSYHDLSAQIAALPDTSLDPRDVPLPAAGDGAVELAAHPHPDAPGQASLAGLGRSDALLLFSLHGPYA
jgi:hypothetical protein